MGNQNRLVVCLEHQRKLLDEFRSVSEQMIGLWTSAEDAFPGDLVHRRRHLMAELMAIQATLGTWITQLRHDDTVTPDTVRELECVHEEIIETAEELLAIDAEACRHAVS